MSAGELALAWLEEHGPIDRPDGSALTYMANQLGVHQGTLGLALRRMSTTVPPPILRRTKGAQGRGGTTWIGLPAQADQAPATEDPPALPDHPSGWTAGCEFCERDPQRTCALHRPSQPRSAGPEEAPTPGVCSPAEASPPAPDDEPERVASVTELPTAERSRRRHPSTVDVEPDGLREEFLVLQERYATLVDELAGMKERVLSQAETIGELRSQKARLMAQVANLSTEVRQAS